MEFNYDLHQLDLDLTDYLLGTIMGHTLAGDEPARFKECLVDRLQSGPELLKYVMSTRQPRLLLTDQNMYELCEAVRRMPLAPTPSWTPWPYAHALYVRTLPWIRREYTKATAEHFAALSVGFIQKLEQEELPLSEGIAVMADWLAALRQLKRMVRFGDLMPRPEGRWPTPANPAPFDGAANTEDGDRPATETEAYALALTSGATSESGDGTGQKPRRPSSTRDILYADEVAVELGLDRLTRPDNAIQRLIDRGDLHSRKISGRLVFARSEIERLKLNGSRRSRRGRPPGARNKPRET